MARFRLPASALACVILTLCAAVIPGLAQPQQPQPPAPQVTKAQVESGEYNRKIDARIADIRSTCGVQ